MELYRVTKNYVLVYWIF